MYHDLDEMIIGEVDYCLQFFPAAIQRRFQHNLGQKISIFNDKSFSRCREIMDSEMKLSAAEGNIKGKRKSNRVSFELKKRFEIWCF